MVMITAGDDNKDGDIDDSEAASVGDAAGSGHGDDSDGVAMMMT